MLVRDKSHKNMISKICHVEYKASRLILCNNEKAYCEVIVLANTNIEHQITN